jgi:hypothetical protein
MWGPFLGHRHRHTGTHTGPPLVLIYSGGMHKSSGRKASWACAWLCLALPGPACTERVGKLLTLIPQTVWLISHFLHTHTHRLHPFSLSLWHTLPLYLSLLRLFYLFLSSTYALDSYQEICQFGCLMYSTLGRSLEFDSAWSYTCSAGLLNSLFCLSYFAYPPPPTEPTPDHIITTAQETNLHFGWRTICLHRAWCQPLGALSEITV